MVDTLWSDVSEFQAGVTDAYPYHFFSLRSHDGAHNDAQFMHNVTWSNQAVQSNRLWGYIVYYFYRPGFDGSGSFIGRVGPHPNPRMVAMIDLESDEGRVAGNQSGQLNREYHALAAYLGSPKRVIAYGNVSDLNALWPQKPPGIRLVVASYGSNPSYPGKFAHQFSDSQNVPPFGPSDINSADGMGQAQLQEMFGFTAPHPTPPPAPVNTPGTEYGPVKLGHGYVWHSDGSMPLRAFAARRNATVLGILRISAECLAPTDLTALNNYVISGVGLPMPHHLAFCTVNP